MSRYTVWTGWTGKYRYVNNHPLRFTLLLITCNTSRMVSQAEATYIAAVPSIVTQLMIQNDKDVVANDMSSGSPLKSSIVQFLNAVKGESSLFVLK
ncbi:uncharacterized protein N7458_001018 [Penicillium daleae]|uniref:Uncharacterized protein n=1 Tax=Penicillium daleae TaxID=63821 RepID=A0AAD6CHD9_9EURO|nr:uncharacterized protein N7458_001018 [Penicillium daleae]KAJ5465332.1 hypothetical protein N7458_001018 [Penicillium daleae]